MNDKVLWSSGRTNGAGVIVDGERRSRSRASCGGRTTARRASSRRRACTSRTTRRSRRQDQAQIYQELVSAPPAQRATPVCGPDAKPEGAAHHQLPVDLRQGEGQPHAAAGLPRSSTQRIEISEALGADERDGGGSRRRTRVGDDPDYRAGGSDSLDLPRAARRHRRQTAGRRAGDALLPGDAAVLSAGPLLHLEQRRHQAALSTSPASSSSPGTAGAGLETARGHQRAGRRCRKARSSCCGQGARREAWPVGCDRGESPTRRCACFAPPWPRSLRAGIYAAGTAGGACRKLRTAYHSRCRLLL